MRTFSKSIAAVLAAVVFTAGSLFGQAQESSEKPARAVQDAQQVQNTQQVQGAQQAPAAQSNTPAQVQQPAQTVPQTGNTVTAWDHDGDGIPNGQDPDFIRGTGWGRRLNFVDANGDGICDFYQNRSQGRGIGRGWRRTGTVTNTGAWGPRFIDLNGDGICDNTGQVIRRGRPGGRGGGPNYVDANGDGICDYYQQGGQRLGRGRGYRSGRGGGRNR